MKIHDIFLKYGWVDSQGHHADGTDKATNHNYGAVYDELFPDREAVRLLLEVGVSKGGSMLAWCEVFPNAHIVGMDVDDNCSAKGPRIEHHVGNVCNREDCARVAKGRLFDVIVEDADHTIVTTTLALTHLWWSVKPGGLYIIEDFAQGPGHHGPIAPLVHVFKETFPESRVYDTIGPRGGWEPLLVLRKP